MYKAELACTFPNHLYIINLLAYTSIKYQSNCTQFCAPANCCVNRTHGKFIAICCVFFCYAHVHDSLSKSLLCCV